MKWDDVDKHTAENVDSTDAKATLSFHELCDKIPKLDSRIAGAIVTRNGKLLATSIGTGVPLPSDEFLTKLILQAQVMVGIPLGNKSIFGDFKFTLVSHENLDTILFYLESENAIVGVGVLPSYDMKIILSKIQNLLKKSHSQREAHTFT